MMTRRTVRRGSQRRGLATFLLIALGVFGLTFAGSVMGTAGGMFAAYTYYASDLPDANILDDDRLEPAQSTYVYDRTGKTLLARFECQNREAVEFGELPEVIWQATVASEDRTYWENNGVDIQATVRAALANLEAGTIVQGASTITQQVIDYARVFQAEGESTQVEAGASPAASVEAADPDDPATEGNDPEEQADVCQPPEPTQSTDFEDKIRENILAMQVTAAYPGREGKERILEMYLNLIYYGNGSYGINAAAANYFGITDLNELSISQVAFLSALPQLPSVLDPYQNPKGEPGSEEAAADALRERDLVLGAMVEENYITAREAREARNTTWLEMEPRRLTSILREPHFSFRVREEAERILGSLEGVTDGALAVRTGGYRIITTLDYELQQEAKRLVAEWVATLQGFNVNNSALVAIDSPTGEIVSYVGSVDYYNREAPEVQGQYDVAGLGRRQPGSAFKPITYASSFKSRDATVSTMLVDAMTEFGVTGTTSYRPTNADIKEHGPVLAVDALRYSLNIPSVQMQYLVGAQQTAEFAESLGIASAEYIMGLDPGLSLALGSVPVNLTNMTQAYSAFAQQGALNPATTIIEIRDKNNRVVYTREDNGPDRTPSDDAGRGLPAALHPRGQHRSGSQHAVGRARAAQHARRPAAARRLQDRDHERLPRRLRLRLRAGQPDHRRVDGQQQPGADVERVLRWPLQRRWTAVPVARLHGGRAQPGLGVERQPTRRPDELPATGRDRERQRLSLDGHVGDEQLRAHGHPAVPRGHGSAAQQRPFARLPRPRAVRGAGDPDATDAMGHRGRRLVRPGGERPDRPQRRSGECIG